MAMLIERKRGRVAQHWLRGAACAASLALASTAVRAAGTVDAALPAYQPEQQVSGTLSSMGDGSMRALMDAWFAAFQQRQAGIRRGDHWDHKSADSAIGALMFELADVAPLGRTFQAAELAPYEHQFHGDMIKAPVLVHVATTASGQPAFIAVNKRPDSPLPQKTKEFLAFALSADGQKIVAKQDGFMPIKADEAAAGTPKIQGFLAKLDPELPLYRPTTMVSGKIDSVGSDGMKDLMDNWERSFRKLQPGVSKGEMWEHLGTLNGFSALLVQETDIAPMGRELWPQEREAYEATLGIASPLEIRVARGGFNTPQRTTAQAIFVNQNNPITQITVPQLKAILGDAPTITRWGQLGLTGDWADKPITIYMPPRVTPNAMSMQVMVLNGGGWNKAVHEASINDTAAAMASDPDAIGFGGFEEGGPGLKTLAVAAKDGDPYIVGDGASASSGRYPLTRYMYIRLNRKPGAPLKPQVKEFLRYILSKDGQEPILYSGYFPLSAAEAKEEVEKLQ